MPADAYYGVQTLRAVENFRITGLSLHPELINSLVQIKKAAAITNSEIGLLDQKKAEAIVKACDEILAGNFRLHFVVDPIQGGAGTSLNMNANEVIANRAIEHLGGQKGDYSLIHPNDHVNLGQSTNDVIPTAGKMTTIRLLMKLRTERPGKNFLRDVWLIHQDVPIEAMRWQPEEVQDGMWILPEKIKADPALWKQLTER